jgi:hypothetical protein
MGEGGAEPSKTLGGFWRRTRHQGAAQKLEEHHRLGGGHKERALAAAEEARLLRAKATEANAALEPHAACAVLFSHRTASSKRNSQAHECTISSWQCKLGSCHEQSHQRCVTAAEVHGRRLIELGKGCWVAKVEHAVHEK